jgi:hypothetical protein
MNGQVTARTSAQFSDSIFKQPILTNPVIASASEAIQRRENARAMHRCDQPAERPGQEVSK